MARSQSTTSEPDGLDPHVQEELERLKTDGYRVHKLWANGIELRKGPSFSEGKLVLQILMAVFLLSMPFVVRSLVANVAGYRHRVLLTLDGHVYFV